MPTGPNPALGLAILRVVLGVVFLTHGLPKLFDGARGATGFLAQLGFPAPGVLAWFVTLLEVLGGALLIIGLIVAPIAALLAIEMVVAMAVVHAPQGWYVVGPGQGGVEFNVLLIAGLLTLILAGPGLAAVDRVRRRRTIGEA